MEGRAHRGIMPLMVAGGGQSERPQEQRSIRAAQTTNRQEIVDPTAVHAPQTPNKSLTDTPPPRSIGRRKGVRRGYMEYIIVPIHTAWPIFTILHSGYYHVLRGLFSYFRFSHSRSRSPFHYHIPRDRKLAFYFFGYFSPWQSRISYILSRYVSLSILRSTVLWSFLFYVAPFEPGVGPRMSPFFPSVILVAIESLI